MDLSEEVKVWVGGTLMDIQEWLELIKSKPYHSGEQSVDKPHGFVVGWKDGRGYVLGPYRNDEEVASHSMEFDPDKFVVIWSKYRQQSKVTQGVKHDRLDSGENLEGATKRMRHAQTP